MKKDRSSFLRIFFFSAAVGAAGICAGPSFPTFLAAAGAAVAAFWFFSLFQKQCGESAFATLDPLSPDETVLREAFRKAMLSCREKKRPVRLRIQAQTTARYIHFSLGMNRKRDMEIKREGKRGIPLDLAGQWIADHPLPLSLPNDRALTLLFLPAQERVRVSLGASPSIPAIFWIIVTALSILFAILDEPIPLAATLGVAFAVFSCIIPRSQFRSV